MLDLTAALANEPYLARMFSELRDVEGPVMVEAGACDGYHSVLFNAAVSGLRQYPFEADPRNQAILRSRGIPFIPYALGAVTGTVPFHMSTPEPNGAVGASSLSAIQPALTEAHEWLRCQQTIEVLCTRLDDFVHTLRLERVDLLWLDVQGAERMVIDGMRGCWRSVRRIFTEFDSGYADSFGSLDELVDELNLMAAKDGCNYGYPDYPWTVELRVPGNALLRNAAFEAASLKARQST